MKRGIIGKSIFTLIVFTFLLSGVFAALPESGKCIINTRAECTGNYHIAMGLSSTTNAHGEIAPGTFSNVLCCAFGTGSTTCTGTTNTIIKLSSTTNAHGEVPDGTVYSTRVCYEDMRCISQTSSNCPAEYNLSVLSLSATTNAHIGTFSTFPIKICCGSEIAKGANCLITDTTWVTPEGDVVDGENVEIGVTGSGASCDNVQVSFDVMGGDEEETVNPVPVLFNGNTATGVWTTQHQAGPLGIGDVSYRVNASITLNPLVSRLSGNQLAVEVLPESYTETINTCSDYTVEGHCNSDVVHVASASSPSTEIDCTSPSIVCSCIWNVDTCKFDYHEIDSAVECTSGQTKCYDATEEAYFCYPGNTCLTGETPSCNSDGICGSEEGCTCTDCSSRQDSCSSGITCSNGMCTDGINNESEIGEGCGYGYTLCSVAGLLYCRPGSVCPTGQTPGNNNLSCDFGIDGCSSSDCKDSDKDTCVDGLYCLNDKCSSVLTPITLGINNCRITQTIQKDCNVEPTGYKTISWSGIWVGNTTSGTAYNRCITGGTDNVPCPAEIQLPFFDYIELIITLVVIAGIYVSLVLKRKLKSGLNKKKHK